MTEKVTEEKEIITDSDSEADNTIVEDKAALTEEQVVDEMYSVSHITDAVSFGELEVDIDTVGLSDDIDKLTVVFRDLVNNIVHCEEPNKTDLLSNLIDEFSLRAKTLVTESTATKSIAETAREWFGKILKRKSKETEQIVSDDKGIDNQILFWKSATGQYRWLTIYSNKYRDNDIPPEILSEKSHETYVKMIDDGFIPKPELWHWHIPGTAWGKADIVAYDKENGFAIAEGYVYEGHEHEAEALMSMKDIAVSHGMTYVKRNADDNSVIDLYVSKEISPLPSNIAANKLTGFVIKSKEDNMAIPDMKKEHLKQVGYSDEQIASIEEMISTKGVEATEKNLEFKEANTEDETQETPKAEATEEIKEVKDEAIKESAEVAENENVETDIVKAITVLTQHVAELTGRVNGLETQTKERTEQEQELTPALSLAAIVSQSLSAVGNKETVVRKNSALATSGPEETDPVKETGGNIMEQVLSNIISNGGK